MGWWLAVKSNDLFKALASSRALCRIRDSLFPISRRTSQVNLSGPNLTPPGLHSILQK